MSNAPAKLNRTADIDAAVPSRTNDSVSWIQRFSIFLVIALLGFAADILSKAWIFGTHFHPGQAPQRTWLIPDVLGIETTTNPGALFGMMPGFHFVFATLSIVVLIGMLIWLFGFGATRDRFLNVCLGLIAGGIMGNLYDRLGFGFQAGYPAAIKHHVRDWILVQWRGVRFLDPWPNFNIADSLLVCGALLLLLHSLFLSRPQPLGEPTKVAGNP